MKTLLKIILTLLNGSRNAKIITSVQKIFNYYLYLTLVQNRTNNLAILAMEYEATLLDMNDLFNNFSKA
jgi:hypothetical protein